MANPEEENPLPKVSSAPLIVDVEFTEIEDDEIEKNYTSDSIQSSSVHSPLELPSSLPSPKNRARIVTVTNQKGGVGKTTSVINIAAQLALRGYSILVVDCDSQGNCATGLGVDKSKVSITTRDLILNPESSINSRHATAVDNLHIIVGDKTLIGLEQQMMRQLGRERRLKEALQNLLPYYDLVIIDTPPSLGLVTINALVASDGILIPVQTEYFALEGLALLTGTIREVRSLLNNKLGVDGIIMTMHTNSLLNQQVAGELIDNYSDLLIKPAIRRNVRIAEAPSHGIPIHLHDPSSAGGKDYQEITTILEKRWGLI